MLKVVFGLFGLSSVFLLPLIGRLVVFVFHAMRGDGRHGMGAMLRLLLSFLIVVAAGTTLEGLLRAPVSGAVGAGHGAVPGSAAAAGSVGAAGAAVLGQILGHGLAELACAACLLVVLPWFLGVGWRRTIAGALRLGSSLGVGLPAGVLAWADAGGVRDTDDERDGDGREGRDGRFGGARRRESQQSAVGSAHASGMLSDLADRSWRLGDGSPGTSAGGMSSSGFGHSAINGAGGTGSMLAGSGLSGVGSGIGSAGKFGGSTSGFGGVGGVGSMGGGGDFSAPVTRTPSSSSTPRNVARVPSSPSARTGASPVPAGAYDWRRAAAQSAREREVAASRSPASKLQPWNPARSRSSPATQPASKVGYPARTDGRTPIQTSTRTNSYVHGTVPAPTAKNTGTVSGAAPAPSGGQSRGVVPGPSALGQRSVAGGDTPSADMSRFAGGTTSRGPVGGGMPLPVQERREPAWRPPVLVHQDGLTAFRKGTPPVALPAAAETSAIDSAPVESAPVAPGSSSNTVTGASVSVSPVKREPTFGASVPAPATEEPRVPYVWISTPPDEPETAVDEISHISPTAQPALDAAGGGNAGAHASADTAVDTSADTDTDTDVANGAHAVPDDTASWENLREPDSLHRPLAAPSLPEAPAVSHVAHVPHVPQTAVGTSPSFDVRDIPPWEALPDEVAPTNEAAGEMDRREARSNWHGLIVPAVPAVPSTSQIVPEAVNSDTYSPDTYADIHAARSTAPETTPGVSYLRDAATADGGNVIHSIPPAKNVGTASNGIGPGTGVPPSSDAAPRASTLDAFSSLLPEAPVVELPPLDLLTEPAAAVERASDETLHETGQLIEQRLREFKVPVTVVGASAGPVITRFEVEPAIGVRGSQIVNLMKDLSRGLGLTSIRVVETIPGKTCMGLELPNAQRQMIRLSEILAADVYQRHESPLAIAMGKDITGEPVVIDLARAPHMLVAGTTGSGKSVAVNAMILSLLFRATPEELRMIMIDPKMLELSVYEGIPHLLAPVVTDMKLAANALNWCVGEMEKRYRLMSAVGVRNLSGYNQKIRAGIASGKRVTNPFSLTPDAPEPLPPLPLIVVIIDELADLMMVAGKKVEELIARLAQKARASGIHLVLATQRPSVDVITGLIKANIPTRVAFQVSSKIDSRTILDQMGAESLLGQGDMLFLPPGSGDPQRVHGAFVADDEVHRVVDYLKQFGEANYEESILAGAGTDGAAGEGEGNGDVEADPLYDEAVAFVIRSRKASISAVQRQLRIGYNRAARLVEQMESAGIVSTMGHNGSRDVLVPEGTQ